MQTFAELLEQREVSMSALARRAGISPAMMSQVSRGHRRLSDGNLARLASVLDMAPSDVLAILTAGREDDSVRARRARYEAQWEHQLRHLQYSYSIEHSVTAILRPDGRVDSLFTRHVRDCLPLDGATVKLVQARDRAVTAEDGFGKGARPHVLVEPACRMDTHVTTDCGFRVARFSFPDGWRRDNGPLEFTLETLVEGGFSRKGTGATIAPLTPAIPPRAGSVSYVVRAAVEQLSIAVDLSQLPAAEHPSRWLGPWAWWDAQSLRDVPDNLIDQGTCRSYRPSSTPATARLEVEAPLAGYSFAVLWEE